MPNLKIAAVAAAASLGSTMMIGTAAMPLNGSPQAGEQVAANIQDVHYQPNHWWQGSGWHRWGPWGWRHRWRSAKGANDRAD